jgi:hypothetical protein
MRTATMWKSALAAVVILAPTGARSQELADYDYANLSFRGVLVEGGYIFANNVEDTEILGLRFDLGFLGPGFRIVPGVAYWNSRMAQDEVDDFETRLGALSLAQGGALPPGGFDLGVIAREDVIFSLDGHYMWSVPMDLFFWTGVGASAHFLNGSGPAVNGTFVEDLLDSVSAGFNVHGGLEYPLTERFRTYGGGKLEVLGDLRYVELRFGLSYIWGELVPGEGS